MHACIHGTVANNTLSLNCLFIVTDLPAINNFIKPINIRLSKSEKCEQLHDGSKGACNYNCANKNSSDNDHFTAFTRNSYFWNIIYPS